MADGETLALVSCSELHFGDPDRPTLDAIVATTGVAAEWVAWDDPSVDWSSYRAAWIRSTWNYTAHYPEFCAWVDAMASATELWNPPKIVTWNSHKSYLLDLEARDVAVVPTVLVPRGDTATLEGLMDERGWSEVVVKPAVSVGAIGTHRVERARARGWRSPSEPGDLLVQPMVAEVVEGETSMIAVEGVVTHAVRKVPAPGDFRVHVQYGGREALCTPTAAELALAEAALAAVGEPMLYARVDCVTTPDGPQLMELELIEPFLFLGMAPPAARDELGAALAARLG